VFVSVSAARLDMEHQEKKHKITLLFLDYWTVAWFTLQAKHWESSHAKLPSYVFWVEGGGAVVEQDWRGGDESRTEWGTALALKFVYELSMGSKVVWFL
jgi:hypothetical protein